MKNLVFLTLLIIFTACGRTINENLQTVDRVDLERYSGTWYEIARLPNRFEEGLKCITATYTLRDDGKITVLNRGVKINNPNKESSVTGKAWIPDSNYMGRLKVSFFGPFRSDYYILYIDDDYEHALVGTPSMRYLWILARKSYVEDETYRKLVSEAKKLGFEVDSLITVEHDCK